MSGQKKHGGFAFPLQEVWRNDSDSGYCQQDGAPGMTLRDYFAAKALQGLLAAEAHPRAGGFPFNEPEVPKKEQAATLATNAFVLADAMLIAREGGAA